MGIKRCQKCQQTLPTTSFSKNKSEKCGLQRACKACFSKYMKALYVKKREILIDYQHKYNADPANREIIKRRHDAWRAANLEKDKAAKSAYRKAHLAEHRASCAAYVVRHKEKTRARCNAAAKAYADNLADTYIKNILMRGTTFTRDAIPQSLVETKRLHIQLTRLIKEKRK